MTLGIVILALVTLQRLGELWLSNRNTKRLLAQGAHEVGASHYPLIVSLHLCWLVLLWWLAPGRPLEGVWLAVFVFLEIARIWVLVSLGPRWTTRIIVPVFAKKMLLDLQGAETMANGDRIVIGDVTVEAVAMYNTQPDKEL